MNILYYFIKNNPEKLLKFYYSRKNREDRDLIIDRLKEIDAVNELLEIREDRPSDIYPFLIEKYKNSKDKLIILYQTSKEEYKLQIINRLKEINSDDALWKIKDEMQEVIYPFLIKKYRENQEKLITLYQTANNEYKEEIIKCLIYLKATYTIMGLKDSFPHITYPYLSQQFEAYDDKLMKIALDNPIAFFSAKESSYSFNEFLSEKQHFLDFIAEFPIIIKEVFIRSSTKIKLYLLLLYYGKSNLKFIHIAPYFNMASDCQKENIKEFSSNFEGFMNKALEGFEVNDYILAFLADKGYFKEKLNYIKKTKTIVVDYDEKIISIKNKYLQQKKNANTKQEIESLLKGESTEIDLIFDQKKVNILMSVMNSNEKLYSSKVLPKPLVSRVESKNKVNLETITINHKLTNSYQADVKKIESELESIIINLNDANEIMKVKARAKKDQNLLIDTKDFCFTLQTANNQLANNDNIIEVLGKFLIRYNDEMIRKAILHFACTSNNINWLKYLEKIMTIDKSGKFIEFYLYFISNNISSKNLKILQRLLESKDALTEINRSNFKELKLITINSKYLLCEKKNELHLLSMFDFEVISTHGQQDLRYALFSPDGLYALVQYSDSIKLLSIPDLAVVSSYDSRNNVRHAHFSPDGLFALVKYSDFIKLLSIPDLAVVSSYNTRYVQDAHFSPDGLYALLQYTDSIKLLSIPDLAVVSSYNTRYVQDAHFSPDGLYALVSNGPFVKLLSIPDLAVVSSYDAKRNVQDAYFSPDGLYALVSNGYSIKLLSIPDLAVVSSYDAREHVQHAHFSPDGLYALVSNGPFVKLLSIPNLTLLSSYKSKNDVKDVHISPDGLFALVKYSDFIKLLSIPDLAVVSSYDTGGYEKLAHLSPDGMFIFIKYRYALFTITVNNYAYILKILLAHLLYLNYFANSDDIYSLIEFKNNISKIFLPSQRDALINLIDIIIQKAGKESKTISMTQEQRADSKDIFVNND